MSEAFDLHWDRGWELYEEKKLEEAISEWRMAGCLDPEDGYVLNNIGLALFELGRQDAAIAKWREAILLEPDYDRPSSNLAKALSSAGNTGEALAIVCTALPRCPDSVDLNNLLGYCLMVQAKKESDRAKLVEAGTAFKKAIAIDPANLYALECLAQIQWHLKQQKEAIETLKAAIAADPIDAEAYIQLWYFQSYARDFRGMVQTSYAMDKLPESEALNNYNADLLKMWSRVQLTLMVGAGLAVLVIGGLIWKKRRR